MGGGRRDGGVAPLPTCPLADFTTFARTAPHLFCSILLPHSHHHRGFGAATWFLHLTYLDEQFALLPSPPCPLTTLHHALPAVRILRTPYHSRCHSAAVGFCWRSSPDAVLLTVLPVGRQHNLDTRIPLPCDALPVYYPLYILHICLQQLVLPS